MAKRMHAILNVVMKVKRFDLTQGRCAEVDAAAHMKAFATNATRDHGQAAHPGFILDLMYGRKAGGTECLFFDGRRSAPTCHAAVNGRGGTESASNVINITSDRCSVNPSAVEICCTAHLPPSPKPSRA
ncbi:hypothetical protein ACEQ6A_27975 [Rhizobium brockwellii]|uniref:hypothetical protein n=1 Tax=Rhizobium TaxID=379 RepID=UPI0013EEC3B7|nr:hypothetical protein [Rhizobium leguminosarum]